jgi:hypothetical protein
MDSVKDMCARTHLYNCINRTRLLTQTTVDALGHIDIVARGSTRSVRSCLRLDRDRLCRTHRLAQFARNASFFAVRISTQRVFAAKAR